MEISSGRGAGPVHRAVQGLLRATASRPEAANRPIAPISSIFIEHPSFSFEEDINIEIEDGKRI